MIYKRGKVWWLQAHRDGGRIRISTGCLEESNAEIWAANWHRDQERLRVGLPALSQPSRTIAEDIEAMCATLTTKGRDAAYVEKARTDLHAAAKLMHWGTLSAITTAGIEFYQAERKAAGDGAKTINNRVGYITTLLKWAHSRGQIPTNPGADISPIKMLRRQVRRALSPDEWRRLLTMANPYNQHVYRFLLCTGLRRTEAALMEWSWLDFGENPTVLVPSEVDKGGIERMIPLPPAVARDLEKLRASMFSAEGAVFIIPRPIQFDRDLAKAGIPKRDAQGRVAVLHSLRHTFVTMLAAAGVDSATQRKLSRHASEKMLAVYQDAAQLPLRAALALLPAAVTGAAQTTNPDATA